MQAALSKMQNEEPLTYVAAADLHRALATGAILVDVRSDEERADGCVCVEHTVCSRVRRSAEAITASCRGVSLSSKSFGVGVVRPTVRAPEATRSKNYALLVGFCVFLLLFV